MTGVWEGVSETERDWDEVHGKKQRADSRVKVKHVERNDRMHVVLYHSRIVLATTAYEKQTRNQTRPITKCMLR